jgi:hypothetical protein
MKRLLFLVVLLAAGIAALGYHQGWFTVTTETTADGKSSTTVTVDKEKIKTDADKAKAVGGLVKDKAVQTAAETAAKVRN